MFDLVLLYPVAFIVGVATGVLTNKSKFSLVACGFLGACAGILLTFQLLRVSHGLLRFALPELVLAWALCAALAVAGGRLAARFGRRA
jgi:hypothetical protein